jgi:H+-transporting ATPase
MSAVVNTIFPTAPPQGLKAAEAAERLRSEGPNTLPEHERRPVVAFLRRFWGVVPWMLEAAIVADLLLGRWAEAAMIGVLLLFQAVLGVVQEGRGRRAMALLQQRVTASARVQRDGRWQTVAAPELVRGDLVSLRAGDIAPADVRLAEGTLSVDASQLTGEALPVEVAAGATVHAASTVRRGEAVGIVTATGARTHYGRTASLLRSAEAPGRLQALTVRIARVLIVVDVALALAVLAAGWWHGSPLVAALPFVLMLLVASVPVAMPAMSTMSATLGARALAEKGVLATRLAALEAAASMDVLCLDKTGTVTENRLSVAAVRAWPGADEDEALRLAAWASDEATQDPIDIAILAAASARGLPTRPPERLDYTPFHPDTKRAEATVREAGHTRRLVKGAPAAVAARLGVPWGDVDAAVERLAADGARVLAVGETEDGASRLVGLVALGDPVRADAAPLVADLMRQGVRVLLVTGDGEATARAVAARIGIDGEVAPPGAIQAAADAAELQRYAVFARVLPEDKFALVQKLQQAGHCVGMTGDGVNDAPALRQADVGIAVAGATDVARAAASLILTRPGLADMLEAVKVSRAIYQRMQSWVLAMITRKTGVPGFLAVGVIAFGVFVINPLLMVLFMLAGDIATFALAGDRVQPSRTPDRWMLGRVASTGLVLGGLLLAASLAVFQGVPAVMHLDAPQAQTVTFVWLVFAAGQVVLYAVRTRGWCWQSPHPGRSLWYASAFDIAFAAVLAIQGWLMAPLPLPVVIALLAAALLYLAVTDLAKRAMLQLGKGGGPIASSPGGVPAR